MSKHHYETITCPNCQKESDFMIWDSINTMLDSDMKEKVRNKEAFKFSCPHCGYEAIVNYTTLYHQMEDKVMIYYINGDPTEAIKLLSYDNSKPNILGEGILEGYKKRVVCSLDEFSEKLYILDEGLDDRIIELMKLYIISSLNNSSPDTTIKQICFDKIDGNIMFSILTDNDRWASTDFSQDLYNFIADKFKEQLKEEKDVVVDLNWALKLMKQ